MRQQVAQRRCRFTLIEMLVAMSIIMILGVATARFLHQGLMACRFASRRVESHDALLALRRDWRTFVHAHGVPFLCTDQRVAFGDGAFVALEANTVEFGTGTGPCRRRMLGPNCTVTASVQDTTAEKLVVLTMTWRQVPGGPELAAYSARLVACPRAGGQEVTR